MLHPTPEAVQQQAEQLQVNIERAVAINNRMAHTIMDCNCTCKINA